MIKEMIFKTSLSAESKRVFNYPFAALEEALCNAVYHRGYDNDSPIEVRVLPSQVDIISYPGPLLPLNKEKLRNLQFDVRKYRNRRVGDFLKELHLTEGRATGIPTILNVLAANSSPAPVFETDDERSYFKCTLKIHPAFLLKSVQVSVQVTEYANFFIINNLPEIIEHLSFVEEQAGEQVRKRIKSQILAQTSPGKISLVVKVLSLCRIAQKRESALAVFKLSNNYKNYVTHIQILLAHNLLARTVPDNPKDPRQKYYTTELGLQLLEILK